MSSASQYRDRTLIATIGDEVSLPSLPCSLIWIPHHYLWDLSLQDTITGLLLAGTGHIDGRGKKNFMVVDASAFLSFSLLSQTPTASSFFLPLLFDSRGACKGAHHFDESYLETSVSTIESAFAEFTERNDIAILLINQHVRLSFLFELSNGD